MRRRDFITLIGGTVAAWPLAARAQQPTMPVIGYLSGGTSKDFARLTAAFRQGLNESGYIEGRNVAIEYRWADGQYDRLPALAADLVKRQIALMAATTTPAALAAKGATSTIPIVFSIGADPVAIGLVEGLSRPSGNITGVNNYLSNIGAKRLELLRQVVPKATTIAGLFGPNTPDTEAERRDVDAAAQSIGLRLIVLTATNDRDIDSAFLTFAQSGAGALLDAIEQLQGAPLPASILETEILPARIDVYDPADLDAVAAAGEVVWAGVEPLGERDGRVALYLADHLPRLLPPAEAPLKRGPTKDGDTGVSRAPLQRGLDLSGREAAILDCLRARGASFFGPLHEAVGGGYPAQTVDALWNLVWQGLITNDTFHALRAFTRARVARRKVKGPRPDGTSFRSRRLVPPSAEGRWVVVALQAATVKSATTKWAAALTEQLLARHGVLTREAVTAEAVAGGFGIVYPALKGLEETGRIRRGYFVAGLGATQFAMPGALDLLRSLRDAPDEAEIAVLAATDPANPYGATLKWPTRRSTPNARGSTSSPRALIPSPSKELILSPSKDARSAPTTVDGVDTARSPTRSVGATVILVNGALAAYLARGDRQLVTCLPDAEPDRSKVGRAVARVLIDRARTGGEAPRGMLIEEIDGTPSCGHPMSPFLLEAGFVAGALGFQATFGRS